MENEGNVIEMTSTIIRYQERQALGVLAAMGAAVTVNLSLRADFSSAVLTLTYNVIPNGAGSTARGSSTINVTGRSNVSVDTP